ncbi:penicillin amidase [Sphaerisporangium melleum]|uniref:Penicillin amidase n=1 Tax=Sphaerisporangium melleum TaxID=321316 RepID=A0A917VK77_9ACTN|nr:penicillin acylase family protein [Sphaerisporangium melleum]GGK89028.1 penicillin amidase [Sphaerisporangium melleum]GII67757.1 penicillin amidase [Sphaerisporangium melleum]
MRLAPFARLSRPFRWAARLLTALLVLALLLAAAGVWTVRRSFPQVDGSVRLPGLSAEVTVLRDRNGIPQIYASTPRDLFMAQGYVHAQDRFWEMDFRRKTTAGRLSELFGASTLEVDKVVRTLGWRRTAERELALLDPRTRQALSDYADGVNAWMRQHDGFAERSLEYAVLKLTNGSYAPEPWVPADSLAWLKAMAWDLRSNMDDELERALDASVVPAERVAQLFPGYPYDRHRPIVTAGAIRDGRFSAPSTGATATTAVPGATASAPAKPTAVPGEARALAAVARTLRAVPSPLGTGGTDRAGIGSNSWVVGGAHTGTGKPLLANDPHLGPRIPSIWYQAGLHCRAKSAACPYDVVGYTFSGLPGVVIGHNDRVAWGFTNLGPDVTDLYLERTKGDTYQVGDAWRPMEVRTEEIKVAGRAPERLTVRATRHGPIVSGVLGSAGKALPGAAAHAGEPAASADNGRLRAGGHDLEVALRWTALDPGRTADALLLLDTAANFDDFRRAASFFEAPAQNMVYADVEGNIGYQAPGRIPIRSKGENGQGQWPARGWTDKEEWTGFIPFDELPTVYNPPEGYIVTANNAAIGPSYGRFLTADWSYGYRSQRITDRVRQALATGGITAQAMSDIQMDSANGLAPLLVPHLLRAGAGVPQARELLSGWDFTQGRDSAPAAYFNAVWRHLLQRTFDDELPEGGRPGGGDRWYEVVRPLLDRPGDPWWDDVRTKDKAETRDEMLVAAMRDASAELRAALGEDPRAWRWGDLHTLELTNETFGTSGIAPVEWLFNRGPLRLGGGKDAVDATGWDATEGYQVDWVPSMRMVVDLADLDRSRWINLTGASGHAFHATYADQAELWAGGGTVPMRQTEPAVRADAVDTLTLTP